ncbi:hypothetical protein [Streptomyces sp. NPDC058620]|uniref:hypothetical protein n=1 Tax=Streptomyces sp. NPDC058620 TaxID=3346560 RepID=UPI00364F2D9F
MPGWKSDKQLHTDYVSHKEDSPGYTQEQAARVDQYRARLLELSLSVAAHPHWRTLGTDAVAARMALKHAHKPTEARA